MKRTKNSFIMVFLLSVILVVPLLIMSPFTCDDFFYYFFVDDATLATARPFGDFWTEIWQSMYNHWHHFNGRVFSHIWVQWVMQYGHNVFVIVATGLFVALLALVVKLSGVKFTAGNYGFVALMAFLFIPAFGQTVLWVSGAGNYLLMTVLQLLYVWLYFAWREKGSVWMYLALLATALLIGNSQENGGPAVFIGISVVWLLNHKGWHGFGQMLLLDLLGAAGFFINFFSPASRSRMASETVSLLSVEHFRNYALMTRFMWPIGILIIVFILWQSRQNSCSIQRVIRQLLKKPIVTFAITAVIVAISVMFFSPESVDRTMFGSTMYLIMIALVAKQGVNVNAIYRVGYGVLILGGMFVYGGATSSLWQTSYLDRQNEAALVAGKPSEDIVATYVGTPQDGYARIGRRYNPHHEIEGISVGKEDGFNEWIAKYYGVKSVACEG